MSSCPTAKLLTMTALGVIASVAVARASQEASPDPLPQLSSDRTYVLDALMERVLQDFSIPGLAIGIVENGAPVYVRAFGVRDTKSGEPVTVHTLFNIASITKTFTATAVMQLNERQQMTLDAPIASYVPAFAKSPITVTQLLTHTAGLRDMRHESATDDASAVTDYVTKAANRKPAFDPGEGWEYSDTAFNVLGAAIESVSRESYAEYIQTQVLTPAGMMESTFAAPGADSNIAWPHTGKWFVRRAPSYPSDRALLPSAGLSASIGDMTRWAALNLNRDPVLLTPASYEEMFRHRLDSGWEGMAMGLGWQLEKRGDGWLPRHAGAEHGFSALLTLYPEQRRAIVILSNGETTPRIELRKLIEEVLAGQSYVPLQPPLLLRSDFQWTLGGLACMTLLLIAVSVGYRHRSGR